jgi:hypothetical protein
MTELLEPYRYGPIQFTLTNDAYERHLLFDNVVDLAMVGPREHYEILHHCVGPLDGLTALSQYLDSKRAGKFLRRNHVLQLHIVG